MATVTEQQAPQQRPQADSIEVMNPATGHVLTTLEACMPERLAEMAARARAAQPEWQALGFAGRGKILRRTQKWLLDNAERVIDTVVSETGKTREDVTLELSLTAMGFGFWAKKAPKYLSDDRLEVGIAVPFGRKVIVRYEPVGLAGIIGPWNYPLVNNIGDAIPALAAGNTVILKPSSVTPLSSLLMEEGLRTCGIPDGVFQVAVGRGAPWRGPHRPGRLHHVHRLHRDGPACDGESREDPHPGVARAWRQGPHHCAARRRHRAGGQRGGVLVELQNAGQTCISVERAYVEEPIYDEFVRRVAEKTAALRQGVPERVRLGRGRIVHQPTSGGDRRGSRAGRGVQGGEGPIRRAPPHRRGCLL